MVANLDKLVTKIKKESLISFLFPRMEDILFLAIFLGVIGLGPRLLNQDGDLGRHLTVGSYILDNLSIPTRDIFSHTMQGMALTPHEWLAQVVFSLTFRMGGMNGVVILCALLVATTFSLVFKQCYERSNMLLISLGMTIIAAAAASIHWLARPHLFTMLFTVLWVGVLENYRKTGKANWWVLPLVMLIWVNMHGAFIAGFVIWGIYLLDSIVANRRKHPDGSVNSIHGLHGLYGIDKSHELLAIGIITLLVTLVNPAGWHIWGTTLGFLQNRYLVEHTVEYFPPNFHQTNTWPFLLMIFLSILLVAWSRRKLVLVASLLLSVWTVLGLLGARNIPLYAVVAAPIIVEVGALLLRDNERIFSLVNLDLRLRLVDGSLFGYIWPVIGILLVSLISSTGIIFNFVGSENDFSPEVFPVQAVDWLIEQPQLGPGFNYFPWGGYLLYRMWPEQLVYIDGQTDFYGESLTRKYEQVVTLGEGWQDILDEYQVQWVIMPSDSHLVEVLIGDPYWDQIYRDETSTVLQISK